MFEDDGASGWGVEPVDSTTELIAIPTITKNKTVASVIVYGEDTAVTYSVYSVALSTGTPTLLGSGTVGTLLDITDFTSGNQADYLLFRFAASTTSQTIYGGQLFTDDLGTAYEFDSLTPVHFFVNDD